MNFGKKTKDFDYTKIKPDPYNGSGKLNSIMPLEPDKFKNENKVLINSAFD